MTVTSVTLGRDVTTINAEGEMGTYDVTFNLTYDADRTSGHRHRPTAMISARTASSDAARRRDFRRHHELRVVTFDPASKDMAIKVHVIK